MNDSNKFCAAPFKEMIIDTDGSLAPCCEYKTPGTVGDKGRLKFMQFDEWQATKMETLRQQMITGDHNPGCTYCKNKESIPGQVNLRKYINQKYINRKYINQPTQIDGIEIRFGNYCNLKCIMCGPYASSSLAEEYLQHKDTYVKNDFEYTARLKTVRWWEETGAAEKLIELVQTAKYLNFAGGEPLMVPEFVRLLDNVNVNTIRRINFNTNMTKFNDKIFAALDRFPRGVVKVYASIEGIGAHNDYIRYGEDWQLVADAVDRIKSLPKIKIAINSVMQATTVYSAPALVKFGKQKNIEIVFGEVYPMTGYGTSGYLTINSVSPADIQQFQQYLDANPHPVLQGWVDKYEFDPEQHSRFRKFTEMIDSIRGTDFKTTFNPNWD
jgi:molybdenum cofactor biosynthesis enzyme MoaA